jgi:putative ribosome biogenesis GTPase RsgA
VQREKKSLISIHAKRWISTAPAPTLDKTLQNGMNKTMSAIKKSTTAPLPVTIVAGFLGAGKTTMINHLLQAGHGRRIAIVVKAMKGHSIKYVFSGSVSNFSAIYRWYPPLPLIIG